jgi:hypothetical protein
MVFHAQCYEPVSTLLTFIQKVVSLGFCWIYNGNYSLNLLSFEHNAKNMVVEPKLLLRHMGPYVQRQNMILHNIIDFILILLEYTHYSFFLDFILFISHCFDLSFHT